MVYMDPLVKNGWVLRGHPIPNCHMFADTIKELHKVAKIIGLKRKWFQDKTRIKHYDLTPSRRILAITEGVKQLTRREAVNKWKILFPR